MRARRLLFAQLSVLILLRISQSIGIYYFDVSPNNEFFAITHFLGGVWAALFIVWVHSVAKKETPIALCIFAAFGVGVFWELFEITTGLTILESSRYTSDTLSDIAMDMFGGLLGGLLARSSVFNEK